METREFWVGYRYTSDGARVDTAGRNASDVIYNSDRFVAGREVGGASSCVGLRGGEFFSDLCTSEMLFLCEYTYSGILMTPSGYTTNDALGVYPHYALGMPSGYPQLYPSGR